ncbi:hypothetical protein RP20_CCG006409 [Aedes albopictus]|nr:hypothetical protein RP20_CCG006409 [Aedes albopictus]
MCQGLPIHRAPSQQLCQFAIIAGSLSFCAPSPFPHRSNRSPTLGPWEIFFPLVMAAWQRDYSKTWEEEVLETCCFCLAPSRTSKEHVFLVSSSRRRESGHLRSFGPRDDVDSFLFVLPDDNQQCAG